MRVSVTVQGQANAQAVFDIAAGLKDSNVRWTENVGNTWHRIEYNVPGTLYTERTHLKVLMPQLRFSIKSAEPAEEVRPLRFNVHMISRIADIDVQIAAMPAESAEIARQNAPQWMSRPDVWLVTDVRKV